MRCSNKKCGKKFAAPLELYNGVLTCPHCKERLSDVESFGVTERNEELYNLSELYYLRYLSPRSYQPPRGLRLTMSNDELLQCAVRFCAEAAKAGHPKAVYRMGYYNEFHLETQRSETERIKKAFDYYTALCYCADNDVSVEKGIKTDLTTENFAALKRLCAVRTMSLYAHHSRALVGQKKYDPELNRRKLTAMYGQAVAGVQNEGGASTVKSRERYVYRILCSCLEKDRAPLFGMFMMRGSDIKALYATRKDPKAGNKYDFFKLIDRAAEMRCIRCDARGHITEHYDDREFLRFRQNDTANRGILDDIPDDGFVHFYFFNKRVKHPHLSGGQIKQVQEELQRENFENLSTILDTLSGEEFMFFCDDIAQQKIGNKAKGSVERLIEYVREVE